MDSSVIVCNGATMGDGIENPNYDNVCGCHVNPASPHVENIPMFRTTNPSYVSLSKSQAFSNLHINVVKRLLLQLSLDAEVHLILLTFRRSGLLA
jgi:hypothetical protein